MRISRWSPWVPLLLSPLAVPTPAAAAEPAGPPICADRPSKANGTCTVPAGHVQVETGLIDWTHDESAGDRSDLFLWGGTFVKYGLSGRSDVELGFVPYETLRTRSAGETDHSSGFGDVTIRMKQRLSGDSASTQVAVIPFVKIPTASHDLGNGKLEGGVAVPVSSGIAKNLSVTVGPELDLRADADGRGHHPAMVQLVNLGFAASSRLTIAAELWGFWDWHSNGTTRQVSADSAAAYLVSNTVQVDVGANFGLNQNTPDIEVYAGVASRF